MCGCCKVLETRVFISCLFCKTPGPRLDLALVLELTEATELLLRLFREFRGSLTIQQKHNTDSALSTGLCEEQG